MEWVSESFYKGYRRRRRNYERLNGPTRRRKLAVIQLGHPKCSNRGQRFLRPVKVNTRLPFSPKRFLISLRDAYVNFMVMLANDAPAITGVYDGVVERSFDGFGTRLLKEYDNEMISNIYASGPFTGHDDKTIVQIYRSGFPKYY